MYRPPIIAGEGKMARAYITMFVEEEDKLEMRNIHGTPMISIGKESYHHIFLNGDSLERLLQTLSGYKAERIEEGEADSGEEPARLQEETSPAAGPRQQY